MMADLLSRSNQVQSPEWSLHPQVFKQICQRWFTPHVDLFETRLSQKLPLYVSPVPDQNAWDIDALNIDWSGLTAYAYPPTALLYRVIQKIRQCHCLIIVISPRLARDALLLGPSAALNRDPSPTSTVKDSAQTVSQLCIAHSNRQHLNLHAWCLRVDSPKNKASLWRWKRELLALRDRQQGPSTSQVGLI